MGTKSPENGDLFQRGYQIAACLTAPLLVMGCVFWIGLWLSHCQIHGVSFCGLILVGFLAPALGVGVAFHVFALSRGFAPLAARILNLLFQLAFVCFAWSQLFMTFVGPS